MYVCESAELITAQREGRDTEKKKKNLVMNILSKTSNKRQDKQDNQIKKNILDFNLNFSFAFLLLL